MAEMGSVDIHAFYIWALLRGQEIVAPGRLVSVRGVEICRLRAMRHNASDVVLIKRIPSRQGSRGCQAPH